MESGYAAWRKGRGLTGGGLGGVSNASATQLEDVLAKEDLVQYFVLKGCATVKNKKGTPQVQQGAWVGSALFEKVLWECTMWDMMSGTDGHSNGHTRVVGSRQAQPRPRSLSLCHTDLSMASTKPPYTHSPNLFIGHTRLKASTKMSPPSLAPSALSPSLVLAQPGAPRPLRPAGSWCATGSWASKQVAGATAGMKGVLSVALCSASETATSEIIKNSRKKERRDVIAVLDSRFDHTKELAEQVHTDPWSCGGSVPGSRQVPPRHELLATDPSLAPAASVGSLLSGQSDTCTLCASNRREAANQTSAFSLCALCRAANQTSRRAPISRVEPACSPTG
ncbi:hypothetical protein CYMTET_29955 [Cymbomonas tetramitiformis]|uniref:Uncharacterized protein n=1 Tax=Cymbomonas tetramitiformis TaxID=36881 RepID=A0AAE0FJR8_9CHLO|nr:hypothetical protein CYMTET_29955 [Cymbomonas tetramitiformis]